MEETEELPFCECGCGNRVKRPWNKFINHHYKITKEHRKKIAEGNKGKTLSEEHKRKIGESKKGQKHTEETKRKMSETRTGVPMSVEHKQKMRDSYNINDGERRKQYSEMRNGCWTGDKNPAWKGGISYEGTEYLELCNVIRQRDNYTCQLCGLKRKQQTLYKFLAVHHIHRDIENKYADLITLCPRCHGQIHGNQHQPTSEEIFKEHEHQLMNILNNRNLLNWTKFYFDSL